MRTFTGVWGIIKLEGVHKIIVSHLSSFQCYKTTIKILQPCISNLQSLNFKDSFNKIITDTYTYFFHKKCNI